MFGYVCDYAKVSPAVLAALVENKFPVLCSWDDRDEDSFFFVVMGEEPMKEEVDALLSAYFFNEE